MKLVKRLCVNGEQGPFSTELRWVEYLLANRDLILKMMGESLCKRVPDIYPLGFRWQRDIGPDKNHQRKYRLHSLWDQKAACRE